MSDALHIPGHRHFYPVPLHHARDRAPELAALDHTSFDPSLGPPHAPEQHSEAARQEVAEQLAFAFALMTPAALQRHATGLLGVAESVRLDEALTDEPGSTVAAWTFLPDPAEFAWGGLVTLTVVDGADRAQIEAGARQLVAGLKPYGPPATTWLEHDDHPTYCLDLRFEAGERRLGAVAVAEMLVRVVPLPHSDRSLVFTSRVSDLWCAVQMRGPLAELAMSATWTA